VLKGPQGTLYGRNATGGAIIITTRKPTFTPTGAFSATGGSFGYYKFSEFISGPIIADKLAGSLSAVTFGDHGYVDNIYLGTTDGRDRGTAVRGKLLFQPSDDLSFQLNGFYSTSFDNVLTSSYALDGNSSVRSLAASPVLNPTHIPLGTLIADQPYKTSSGLDPVGLVKQSVGDAHVDWNLGWASLSALASLGRTRATNLSLTDASPLLLSRTQYTSDNHSYNQELVLTSPGDQRVTWIAGVTGFEARDTFPLISTSRSATTGIATPANINYGQDANAVAGFGEMTWNAFGHLFLTGGLRYSWDQKSAFNQTNTAPKVSATSDFNNVSPRGVLRYEWTKDTDVYFSYSEGYKSGGFNATSAAGVVVSSTGASAAVRPETVKAYELGLKTQLGGRVRADVAAYHYDYSDLQVSAAVLDPVTHASLTNLQNAGVAEINGFEASIVAELAKGLSVNASTELMKAVVHQFSNAVLPLARTNLPNCVAGGIPALTGNVTCTIDVSGNDLIRAPRYTYSLGSTYATGLAGGDLSLNVNAFFSGRYFADLSNVVEQPAYKVVNASATWRAPQGHLYFTVFGDNLTDQVYAVGHLVSTFITASQAAKPRWYGVTVGYDF